MWRLLSPLQSWTHNISKEKEFLMKLVKAGVIQDWTNGICGAGCWSSLHMACSSWSELPVTYWRRALCKALCPAESSHCHSPWSPQKDCMYLRLTEIYTLAQCYTLTYCCDQPLRCITVFSLSLPQVSVYVHGFDALAQGSSAGLNQHLDLALLQLVERKWEDEVLSLCQEYLYKCPSAHTCECNLHQAYSNWFISSSLCVKEGERWPSRPWPISDVTG